MMKQKMVVEMTGEQLSIAIDALHTEISKEKIDAMVSVDGGEYEAAIRMLERLKTMTQAVESMSSYTVVPEKPHQDPIREAYFED